MTRTVLFAFLFVGLATPVHAVDLDRAPVNYSSADAHDVVERLQQRLEEGQTKLTFEEGHGYLRSLLRELRVPPSSQMLVFSKTSLQRQRINPRTPRAIYFGDDVYVGYCQKSDHIEVTADDPELGPVFYSLIAKKGEKPRFKRETDSCLICHASSANQGYPGHLVRSVYADGLGLPVLGMGTYRTDHGSPLPERWGGWYVTGTSGKQMHMGNMITRGTKRPEEIDNAEGVNVVDLKDRLTISFYPTPHSDIVALMVLEHQTGMLNRLARAALETRMALHYESEMNKALGRPADEQSESARSRIRSVGDDVVQYMLLRDEIKLTDRIQGTSTFAADFAAKGPKDSKGRSLRDLDLETRLFRHPCSYLIYTRAFDALPGEAKEYIYQRLWDILNGRSSGKDDPKLASEDRDAIIEILRETKPNLPDYWKSPR